MAASTALIIGRFQILQRGHGTLLRTALAAAARVIVVIGSSFRSRDSHNPFSWEERRQQFEAVLSAADRKRVSFLPVRDYYDDLRWSDAVRRGVAKIVGESAPVTLVGFRKDHSSAYLDDFPGWTLQEVEPEHDISATDLRNIYFESSNMNSALTVLGNYVEPGVRSYLEAWAHLPAYRYCVAQHNAVKAYRLKWTAQFFLTADALVTANRHVLLIKRGGEIGYGQWALPGGYVEPLERFYAAAVRELAEETAFEPHAARLKSAFKSQAVFDHPGRSARGRIITAAFHFDLGEIDQLPEVRGQDDAKLARWIDFDELPEMESQLFEDHACILDHFLGVWTDEIITG